MLVQVQGTGSLDEKFDTDVYESGHSMSAALVPFFFLILYKALSRTSTHFIGKYLVSVFHLSITSNVKVSITDFRRDESKYTYLNMDLYIYFPLSGAFRQIINKSNTVRQNMQRSQV